MNETSSYIGAVIALIAAIILGIIIGVFVSPIVYLLYTGDFPGAAMFYGLQEDDAIVTFLLNLR